MLPADRRDWTAPGPHEVSPGVYRIVCPLPNDGLTAVNVYAIRDGDGFALVDTGWGHPESRRALEDGLAALGAGLSDVTVAICTHAHYDHYGFAAEVRRASSAPVLLGRIEAGNLEPLLTQEAFVSSEEHRQVWLARHGAHDVLAAHEQHRAAFDDVRRHASWEPPDELIDDGQRIVLTDRVLEARLTPGHTRGHLMLVDREERLLFSGDHVLPTITPSLGFEPYATGSELTQFLGSLDASRDIDAGVVLPGHGWPFADLRGRIDELEQHHRGRLDACLMAIDELGPAPAAAVAGRLTWTRIERPFAALDAFNRLLAVIETISHLELLADRGALARTQRADGTELYAAIV